MNMGHIYIFFQIRVYPYHPCPEGFNKRHFLKN